MSTTQEKQNSREGTPEIDTREYGRGEVTFYEVGKTDAWMEVPESAIESVDEWR